jgi:hypothetical protein
MRESQMVAPFVVDDKKPPYVVHTFLYMEYAPVSTSFVDLFFYLQSYFGTPARRVYGHVVVGYHVRSMV